MHAVHELAPGWLSLSVTDPGAHAMQLVVDAVLYLPALHAVHDVAPVPMSVLVTEPGEHAMQLVVEAVL